MDCSPKKHPISKPNAVRENKLNAFSRLLRVLPAHAPLLTLLLFIFYAVPGTCQVLKGLDPAEVRHFEQFYSVKLKSHTLRGLKRSGRFMPAIVSVFSEYGIPEEMAWLVLVESNFNETARSPAAACGLFQFIAPTARGYNLHVDGKWPEWFIDERLEFYYACHASASFLSELYTQFGDWVAVLAAYNTGPGNLRKAMKRAGGSSQWLEYRKYLAKETREYPNRIAAVIRISKNPGSFGLNPTYLPYIPFTLYILRNPMTLDGLANRFGGTRKELFRKDFLVLNRQFNEKMLVKGREIPNGFVAKLPEISTITSQVEETSSTTPKTDQLNSTSSISNGAGYLHLVEKGENLAMLGFVYRLSQTDIVKQNPMIKGYDLQPGMKIKLTIPPMTVKRGRMVKVQAGETVGSLVMRLKINGSALVSLNQLRNSRPEEGRELYVPR